MLEQSGKVDWNDILNLIHITNMEHAIVEQYKNAVNLNVRIALHQRFSHNPVPWFTWLADQIALKDGYRVLETGCGNGELWCHRSQISRYLSVSDGHFLRNGRGCHEAPERRKDAGGIF